MWTARVMLCVLLVVLSSSLVAQDDGDAFIDGAIAYGQTVTGTIKDDSYFDFWNFGALKGDRITVTMAASDGLAPLIGIIDSEGNALARSDAMPDGSFVDAQPNSTAAIHFTIPEEGQYRINATRAGNVNGVTEGSYTLTLVLDTAQTNALQDVTFLCGSDEVTTAGSFAFYEDTDYDEGYRISVFGLDGFRPVLRIETSTSSQCIKAGTDDANSLALAGVVVSLPDGEVLTIPDEAPENVAQISLPEGGVAILTVASIGGAPGRYVLLIEGFSIKPAGDLDRFVARLGPLATASEMLVYMLHTPESRIDPVVEALLDPDKGELWRCDDAGRRDCADVPSASEFGIVLPDEVTLAGTNLDAGVRIATGNPGEVALTLGNRNTRTEGGYVMLAVGELPAR